MNQIRILMEDAGVEAGIRKGPRTILKGPVRKDLVKVSFKINSEGRVIMTMIL